MQQIKNRLWISLGLVIVIFVGVIILFLPTKTKQQKESPKETIEEESPVISADTSDTDSMILCANKKHKLPEGYEPRDLVDIDVPKRYDNIKLRQEAAEALKEMVKAAEKEGVNPIVLSAFRSQVYQDEIYHEYANNYGEEEADRFSSRPGYSDHQTGLAIDFVNYNSYYDLSEEFETTKEGIWLAKHSHEYGFIMRYPKGKEAITGYIYEPWHFRYIGVEYATAIYEIAPDYTFEEYFQVEGGEYSE